jgi:hypothetical protein
VQDAPAAIDERAVIESIGKQHAKGWKRDGGWGISVDNISGMETAICYQRVCSANDAFDWHSAQSVGAHDVVIFVTADEAHLGRTCSVRTSSCCDEGFLTHITVSDSRFTTQRACVLFSEILHLPRDLDVVTIKQVFASVCQAIVGTWGSEPRPLNPDLIEMARKAPGPVIGHPGGDSVTVDGGRVHIHVVSDETVARVKLSLKGDAFKESVDVIPQFPDCLLKYIPSVVSSNAEHHVVLASQNGPSWAARDRLLISASIGDKQASITCSFLVMGGASLPNLFKFWHSFRADASIYDLVMVQPLLRSEECQMFELEKMLRRTYKRKCAVVRRFARTDSFVSGVMDASWAPGGKMAVEAGKSFHV